MKRNAALYPLYLILIRSELWLAVFFLYFISLFPLDKVLLLEAVYYISVVVLEVPSGYMSDRFGRKGALLVATLAGTASGLIFAFTRSFGAFCAAQALYAAFMAFNSGSDTSLLYDSLKAEGREGELLDIEGSALSKALFFGALGCMAAGGIALWGFEWVYILSALSFAAATVVVLLFVEPPVSGPAAESSIVRQLGACRKALTDPMLKWLFVFYVGRTIFEHIPYEFTQPYLGFLVSARWLPLIAGAHAAAAKLVSSAFARKAPDLGRRWGTLPVLIGTHLLILVLILLMGLWVHPAVAVLLLFRNLPHGLGQPVLMAAVHPRLASGLRATYLSLQSLVGRLSFSISLAGLSRWAGPGVGASREVLSELFFIMAGFSALWLVWIAFPPCGENRSR